MGRRPKRSDNAPWTGEITNCISAQAVPNSLKISAARALSPERKPTTSRGQTGMMMPSASMSSMTVMKMKTSAAGRGSPAGLISLIGALEGQAWRAGFHSGGRAR